MWGVTKPQRFPDLLGCSAYVLPNTPLLWLWQHNVLNEIAEPARSVLHLCILSAYTAAWWARHCLSANSHEAVKVQPKFRELQFHAEWLRHCSCHTCHVGHQQLSLQITVDVTRWNTARQKYLLCMQTLCSWFISQLTAVVLDLFVMQINNLKLYSKIRVLEGDIKSRVTMHKLRL